MCCVQVVKAGFSVIQSQGWYGNAQKLTVTWEQFYMNEPMLGITDPQEQVLNGAPLVIFPRVLKITLCIVIFRRGYWAARLRCGGNSSMGRFC